MSPNIKFLGHFYSLLSVYNMMALRSSNMGRYQILKHKESAHHLLQLT